MTNNGIEALTFDVFGTVVDWCGTIVSEGKRIAGGRCPDTDWGAFAGAWARSYGESVGRLQEWTNLDVLLRGAFDRLAPRFGLDRLEPAERAELAGVWTRLRPWPDARTGFDRLRGRFTLAALTNANITMLDELARSTGLPWDRLLSAEIVHCYKPCSDVYQMALEKLKKPA